MPFFIFGLHGYALLTLLLLFLLRGEGAFFTAAEPAMGAHAFEEKFGCGDELFRRARCFDSQRRELFGETALALKRGELALSVHEKKVVLRPVGHS